jgi:hypothetical protein
MPRHDDHAYLINAVRGALSSWSPPQAMAYRRSLESTIGSSHDPNTSLMQAYAQLILIIDSQMEFRNET